MSLSFNYRHLYYFWVVAKEGSITRAAERLDVAVQTISAQVRELEQSLGYALLKPLGRGLTLTDAGAAAVLQADQIFQLGEHLPGLVSDAATRPATRLAVGVSDGLPKLAVHRLMQPVLNVPNLRLLCRENAFEDLLADLALHRLDMVLADRPPPTNPSLRVYGHRLGSSDIAWYAPACHLEAAGSDFPQSLAKVPVLLPTSHSAVRAQLDQWFLRLGMRPAVTGEFEDSALLKTFGAGGMGVFPAASLVEPDLLARYGVTRVGPCEGVAEQFHLIATERKLTHPLVKRLLPSRAIAH
jgi:LysR family transcriptional activator of nhaA